MQIYTECPVPKKVVIILFLYITFIIMIFQIMPIVKVRASNYLARFVRYQAILNLIKLKIYRAYPYLKPHILFCSNGLAIWHRLSDIRHIKVKAA